MKTAGDIVRLYKQIIESEFEGMVYVNIDDTGLGGGVTDRLREVKREQNLYRMIVIPINAAEKIEVKDKSGKEAAERYNNLTTHMWACLKELLENKDIELQDDSETIGQLSARKYYICSNGKIELESKKEMKKRGISSPDRADALALSVYTGKFSKHIDNTQFAQTVGKLGKNSYWSK